MSTDNPARLEARPLDKIQRGLLRSELLGDRARLFSEDVSMPYEGADHPTEPDSYIVVSPRVPMRSNPQLRGRLVGINTGPAAARLTLGNFYLRDLDGNVTNTGMDAGMPRYVPWSGSYALSDAPNRVTRFATDIDFDAQTIGITAETPNDGEYSRLINMYENEGEGVINDQKVAYFITHGLMTAIHVKTHSHIQ